MDCGFALIITSHQADAMLSPAVTIVINIDPELSLQRCFGPDRRHLRNQNGFLNDCHGNEEGCMMLDDVVICHCKSLYVILCHFHSCLQLFLNHDKRPDLDSPTSIPKLVIPTVAAWHSTHKTGFWSAEATELCSGLNCIGW